MTVTRDTLNLTIRRREYRLQGVVRIPVSLVRFNSGIPGDSYFKAETNHGVPREECDKIGCNDETHFPPYQSRADNNADTNNENVATQELAKHQLDNRHRHDFNVHR